MNDIPLERRDIIAERLRQGQPVVAATLAHEFSVSEDAIRRDLRALAAQGLCRRVYGGALPVLPVSPASAPMASRLEDAHERKEALARAAAPLVQPGELVFLDNGSTNLALVRLLPVGRNLTVATNSIPIAAAVLQRPDLRLVMVGGAVDPAIGGCVDATAVASLAVLNIDRCFLGACAVSAADGIGAFDLADATFKRAVHAASRHRVVLATSDKLETRAPYRVAAIDAIEQLVVEHDAAPDQLAALERAGAAILAAPL
jgi:DeoR/GlpR family transcriptional regulator of sugar metabolism